MRLPEAGVVQQSAHPVLSGSNTVSPQCSQTRIFPMNSLSERYLVSRGLGMLHVRQNMTGSRARSIRIVILLGEDKRESTGNLIFLKIEEEIEGA